MTINGAHAHHGVCPPPDPIDNACVGRDTNTHLHHCQTFSLLLLLL